MESMSKEVREERSDWRNGQEERMKKIEKVEKGKKN